MAWTTPRTWTTGEIVTASIMNTDHRDNLQWLYDNKVNKAGDTMTGALGLGGAAASGDDLRVDINAVPLVRLGTAKNAGIYSDASLEIAIDADNNSTGEALRVVKDAKPFAGTRVILLTLKEDGSLILGTDPGGSELLRVAGDIKSSGRMQVTGAGPHSFEDEIRLLEGGSGKARYSLAATTFDALLEVFNDTSWVTALKLIRSNGQVQLPDGSAGVPALAFINDSNTGIYRSGGDTFDIVSGGQLTGRLKYTNPQLTVFGGSGQNAYIAVKRAADNLDVGYQYINGAGAVEWYNYIPQSNTALYWAYQGSTKMLLTSSAGLTLVGDSNNNGGELTLQVANNNTADILGAVIFRNNPNNNLAAIKGQTISAVDEGVLSFFSKASGGSLTEGVRLGADQILRALNDIYVGSLTAGKRLATDERALIHALVF